MDGFHNDSSDLTFVTYFNMDFEGGKFEYIDNDGNNVFINPEVNLTLIMDQNPSHRVTKVTKGERFSLVVFLTLILENEKNRKTII
jgi:predicted 2-oxoglutarate/Fe(II)-dependent dioxygenase YbiX